jgi:MoaA/NifB/PqqE/SkfB family radical SAM enzyme
MKAMLEPLKEVEIIGDTVTIKTTMSKQNEEELINLAKVVKEA